MCECDWVIEMMQHQGDDAREALSEALECCHRIISALDVSSGKAEKIGDLDMVGRLVAARAAADRAFELIGRLSAIADASEAAAD